MPKFLCKLSFPRVYSKVHEAANFQHYVLCYLDFTTCVLSTGFSSPDPPSLVARCFCSARQGRVPYTHCPKYA
jgi:hypothetical protein